MFKARRIIAGGLAVWYLAALLGVPLPGLVETDLSRPYPCQDHRCGCRNADQCWRHCCCFSHEEKLSWARAHGVNPPADFVAQSSTESHTGRSCCAKGYVSTPNGGHPSCCDTSTTRRTCCESQPSKAIDSLSTIEAMQCRGLVTTWLMLSLAAPPDETESSAPDPLPIAYVPLLDEAPRVVVITLDPPPPEARS